MDLYNPDKSFINLKPIKMKKLSKNEMTKMSKNELSNVKGGGVGLPYGDCDYWCGHDVALIPIVCRCTETSHTN